MSLSPILADAGEHFQFIFTYEMANRGDEETEQEELETFLEEAHKLYYERYTLIPSIAKNIRNVDIPYLASQILAEYSNSSKQFGQNARLYVTACVEKETKEKKESQIPFSKEYLKYTIHWYGEQDRVIPVFPLGFQTFHNLNFDKGGVIISTIMLDLRIPNSELEHSMEFIVGEAIPDFEPYLEYLETIFEVATEQNYTIDNGEVLGALTDAAKNYYERRLRDPEFHQRIILSLDAVFVGTEKDDLRLSLYIRQRDEAPTTPHLPNAHPQYKAATMGKDRYIKVFHTGKGAEELEEVQR